MRKICLILSLVVFLCSCTSPQKQQKEQSRKAQAVWISYREIDEMLSGDFKGEYEECLQKCKEFGISDIFVHTTAFADSLFDSQYFPLKENAKKYTYDIFEYMIKECHKSGMRLHAWINPYRVSLQTDDISALHHKNPASVWLGDQDTENDINVCIYNGIYLNPAEYEVRKLIINSVREIITKYNVDGIHFDDYFYPTDQAEFDSKSYEKYCASASSPLALADWRRANVNALISGCYTAIKFVDKDIVFSISPAASIEKNYNQSFADVEAWIKSGCVDVIVPQLYFGFEYPDQKYTFENLLSQWEKLVEKGDSQLWIGLAAYKIGTETQPDCIEWQDKGVLSHQVEICENDNMIDGYSFFSYTSLFSNEKLNIAAREEVLKIKKTRLQAGL